MGDFYFFTTCMTWDADNPGLDIQRMVDGSRYISRETFLKHVNRRDLREVEAMIGYARHPSQGPTMAGAYNVSYHRGRFCGVPAYFFVWSAVEHIFVRPEDLRKLRPAPGPSTF